MTVYYEIRVEYKGEVVFIDVQEDLSAAKKRFKSARRYWVPRGCEVYFLTSGLLSPGLYACC